MRNNHAIRAAVERVEDLRIVAGGRANQHRLASCARRENAQIKAGAIKRRVLGIEHQHVECAQRQHFGHMWMRRLDPGSGQQLPRPQALAQAHHRFPVASAAGMSAAWVLDFAPTSQP